MCNNVMYSVHNVSNFINNPLGGASRSHKFDKHCAARVMSQKKKQKKKHNNNPQLKIREMENMMCKKFHKNKNLSGSDISDQTNKNTL